jgi:hypothetical protein
MFTDRLHVFRTARYAPPSHAATKADLALGTRKIAASVCGQLDDDRSQLGIRIISGLCAVALFFVVVRVATRLAPEFALGYGWDDTMLIFAFLCALSIAVIGGFLFTFGAGKDIWDVPAESLDNLFFVFYLEEISYTVATGAVKIALLAFLIRLFPSQNLRRAAWATIAFTTALTTGFTLLAIFQCTPVSYMWHQWNPQFDGKCVDIWTAIVVHAVINIMLDLIIIVIPMPTLYHLRTTRTKKIQILLMFAVGLIITIVSVLRFDTLRHQAHSVNPSRSVWAPALWSAVEVYVSIICACLPAFKLLLKHMQQWWQRRSASRGDHQSESQKGLHGLPSDPQKIYKRTSVTISSASCEHDEGCLASPEETRDRHAHVFAQVQAPASAETGTSRGLDSR